MGKMVIIRILQYLRFKIPPTFICMFICMAACLSQTKYSQEPLAKFAVKSVSKDKITFATRLNGELVYAETELLLPLEILWYDSGNSSLEISADR